MFVGDFFITPHAVRQFQNRIAPWMSYEQALGAVIRELSDAGEWRSTQNGRAQYVRTTGRWQFRAVIMPGEENSQPVVVTILRGGKGKRRRRSVSR